MNKHILGALIRRVSSFLFLTLSATPLLAQYYMDIHQSSGVLSFLISNVDTVKYEADKYGIYSMEIIRKNSATSKVRVSEIDSVKIYSKSNSTDTIAVIDDHPFNEIWYTSTDGQIVTPKNTSCFGANVVSNTYSNGKGVIRFDADVTMVGDENTTSSVDAPFNYVYNLESISLPQSVKKIGFATFFMCRNLKSIQMPDSLEYLSGSLIEGTSIKELYIPKVKNKLTSNPCYGNDSLRKFTGPYASPDGRCLIIDNILLAFAPAGMKSYTIPDGIEELGGSAFCCCYELETVTLSSTVKTIGGSCFGACRSLKDFVIPETVRSIEVSAFDGCISLTSIHIPQNTEISSGVFDNCTSLTKFSGRYSSDDGRCLIKYNDVFGFAPYGLKEYSIPDGVKAIYFGFYRLKELQKLTIPASVTNIYFLSGDSIKEITSLAVNPPTVSFAWSFEFKKIQAIYVPAESVEAYKAAQYWSNYADRIQAISQNTSGPALTHEYVDLGLSVLWATCNVGADTPEGYGDYFSWGEIETYYEDGYSQSQNPVWKDGKSSGYNWSTYKYSFGSSGKMTKYCLDASYGYNDFVDNKKELDPEDDAASTLWGGSWRVPSRDEWDELKNSCSWIWTTLNGVKGYKVTSLVAGFENSSIFLPAAGWRMGVELSDIDSIGHYWINEVEPPSSFSRTFCIYPSLSNTKSSYGTARDIGQTIRPVCADTNSVTIITDSIPHNEIWYTSTDGAVVTPYDAGVFGATIVSNTYVNGKGIIQFDSPISGVGSKAFYQSNNLRTISLPEGCTQIGSMSFEACYSLTYISIPSTIKVIGSDAFYFCMLLENVSLPQSLQTIMQAAFCGCEKLKEITIPESVVSIGGNAFSSSGITTFKGKYADVSGKYLSDGESLIAVARSDSSRFTIPAGIKNILDGVFYSSKFSEIILPEGLRSIGKQTFGDCDSLTTMVVPNSVTAIASGAFRYCDNLTTVILPKHMQGMNWELFNGCSKLANFVIPDSVSKIENFAFLRCVKLSSIVIPEKVTQIGGQAFDGCSGLDSIVVLAVQPPVGGENMFRNTNDCPIYVPAGSVNAYKSAEYWSEYADRIQAIPSSQPNNEIWYTSTDGNIVVPTNLNCFGATLISNTYENGKGILLFDGEVTMVGDEGYSSSAQSPFNYTRTLETISLPKSVKKIGGIIFNVCSGLKTIQLPDSLDYIGVEFVTHSSIKEIFIPETKNFGYTAPLGQNDSLSRFTGPYASSDGRCLIKDNILLSFARANLKSYKIPEGVTRLIGSAFVGCKELEHIELPSTLIRIGGQCFISCSNLKDIIIPESVTKIDGNAFVGCHSLKSIHIPENADIEEYGVFKSCDSLSSFSGKFASTDGRLLIKNKTIIAFAPYGLKRYVIPDGVESIESGFYDCRDLLSVTIPESVVRIGTYAFAYCDSLEITILCSTPPVLGSSILLGTKDNSIYVPAEAVDAYKAAEGWSSYADRIVAIPNQQPSNEIWYTSTDGKIVTPNRSNVFGATIVSNTYENGKGIIKFDSPVKSIGDNAFARRDSLSSIMIPDSVKIIERYAFSGCGNLTSMSISKSVSSIGECAFESCYKLSSVTIPEGVTNIGRGAFMGCRNLSSLDLSKTISYIGDYAFSNCQSLTSLIFPEGIDSLGMNPFRGCNNVESISVAQGNTVYDSRNGCNAVIETATNKLVLGCKNTVIPVEVTAIGDLAFYGSGITSCTIPDGVTSIGLGAFFGCSGLSSLIIPEGVESIGMAAWGYCTGLTSISVAPGNAYYDSRNGCNAIIETATGALVAGCNNTILPPDITAIGGYALCGISGIDTLVIPAGVLTIEEGAFAESPDLKSLIIPEGVTSIGGMALGDCSGLKSLIIPSSVTSIGDGVFNRCSSLENITFLSTVPPAIGEIVFQSTNNCPIYVPSASLAAYKAAERWSEYSDRIQANPNQQPSNEIWYTSNNGQIVTPNQSNVFGATIVSNTYENGKGILKFDAPVTAVGNQAFVNCRGLKTIAIPDSVTSIGTYAFYYCDNLSEISMPDEVITIGNYAFNNCKNITSFIFPDSVTRIGAYAFNGCTSLSSLIIPAKVNEIGNDAFDGCRSLNSIIVAAGNTVYDSRDNCNAVIRIQTKSLIVGCKNTVIPSTVKTIGSGAFDGQSDLSSITIPEGVSKIESSAFRNTGLTSLSVPVSLTNISGSAFRECVKLSTISVTAGNTKYDSRNNCNAIVETSTNQVVVGCRSTVIPPSVTSIGSYAFYGCDSLTSIVIPETVISIGSSAFYGCKGLTSISIPSSITSISDYAFAYCSGITSLTLPESVENIGSYAFSNCKGLTSVVIPSGVTNMSYDVFYYCSNLEYLEILPVVPPVLAGSNPFRETNYCLLYVPEESVDAYKAATYWSDYANRIVAIPERQPNNEIWYTSTNGNAVSPNRTDVFGATIQSNTYENGKGVLRFDSPITIIGNSAFEGCGNLLTLSIPESVSNIGANAFADCDMTYIKILNTTPASLGTDAFDNNNCALYVPLESKYFYKVADGWRANISALQVIPEQQVPDNEIWYTTTDNSVVSINYANCFGANIVSNTYENGKGIIRFDGAVTMLGDENSHSSSTGAFSFVRNLKTITLPNSVKKIGTCSFLGCWGLKKIQFPEHLDFLANGFCEETAIEELFIPETSIIYSCSLAGNSKLKKVTGPYASPDGKWLIKGDSLLTVFLRDDASITVPDGVTVLCQYAFGLCTKVEEVELPSSVRVIESSCFLSRRTLTKIDIPESVTRIGSFAFEDCIGLTSLVVPGNVSSIDNGAFRGCTQLTNIKFLSTTPPSVVGDILDNTNNCPIYVPAGSVDAYKAASGWSTYADRIQAIPQENT